MPQLSLSRDSSEHVAVLTLHNPPQNRIGVPMTTELLAAVDEITAHGARAVVLHAEGPDFSYGGDIVPWEGQDVRELRASFELFLRAFNAVEQLPVPVIAAVHGLCFGGGFELALRADVLFAGESARFGHPEQTLGIVTLLGGIHRVAARAGRARAMEWALTSEPVPAAEMAQAGVVNRVVPDEQVFAEALAFARRVAQGPTRAHAVHKALLRTWETGGTAAADQVLFDLSMPLYETEDARRGLASAITAYQAGRPRPVLTFDGR
ncbi:enoyl-CoA hydratase/isomerase family protein [Amycolatopsis sp. CA-161197]|uniref:enoyl-CoA hydratase/isomerase family protein n=1 Tax=Amycolatopsis sp. CA-161197 TaxID=3239922 RepID=UPI003D8D0DE6